MAEVVQLTTSRSSRNGVSPRIMVLHTTEGHNRPGVSDLTGLASFFNGVQASSHLGIDQEGNCVRMVPDVEKAWTQSMFNSLALSIEQVGFSAFEKRFWIKDYHRGLKRVAEALADWSIKYDIPLRHSTTHGVCQHKDLGAAGGGHHDCGSGYPFRYVIFWARLFKLRKTGKRKSLKARFYKARVRRNQRRYGLKGDTE